MESSGFLGFCSKKTNEKQINSFSKAIKTIAKGKMLDHTKIIDKIIKNNVKRKEYRNTKTN